MFVRALLQYRLKILYSCLSQPLRQNVSAEILGVPRCFRICMIWTHCCKEAEQVLLWQWGERLNVHTCSCWDDLIFIKCWVLVNAFYYLPIFTIDRTYFQSLHPSPWCVHVYRERGIECMFICSFLPFNHFHFLI